MINSCKKTTELIDKQQITSLTTKEKLQLQIHKSMCNTCNAYEQQSKLIENVVANWFNAKSQKTVRFTISNGSSGRKFVTKVSTWCY